MTTVLPRASFVVPSYNYGRFLRQAIDSLLAQTYEPLEVIVIDDASTDGSQSILERYRAHPRVRLIQHPTNRGHIRSYNEGLSLASGEFVGLLAADDFCIREDAVARQVAVFDADPNVGLVYSAYASANEEGHVDWIKKPWPADYVRPGLDEFKYLVFNNYVLTSGTLIRRRCHERFGYYDERLPYAGDWELWLRVAANHDIGYIAEPLYAWRIHSANMHHHLSTPAQATREHVLVVRNAFDSLPPTAPAAVRNMRGKALRRARLRTVSVESSSGRTWRSWQAVWQAVTCFPESLLTPEFHVALAKVVGLTILGYRRCVQLVAWKNALASRSRSALRAG